ncbi:hypothetical protein [Mycolicibacterium sp.]|uniref:hypothetical protein n=1 Tax=Mycolicibacterium sp. TaxID=2320850 RepID=UPI000AC213CB
MTGCPSPHADQAQALPATARGAQLRELLRAYQEVLDTIDGLSPVPMVLTRHRGRLHYLPRLKWPVRHLAVRHIRRTLGALSRRYSARAAIGAVDDGEQSERDAIREFEASLTPDRNKLYLVLLIAAIVIFCRPVIGLVGPAVVNFTARDATDPALGDGLRRQLLETVHDVGSALSANVSSVSDAVDALISGGVQHLVAAALCIAMSSYVVLRPMISGFRLKRMLFNLSTPDEALAGRSAVSRWSITQSTGLYAQERMMFAALGGHAPREFPLDLAVSTLATAFPLGYVALQTRIAILALTGGAEYALTGGRPVADEVEAKMVSAVSGMLGISSILTAVCVLGLTTWRWLWLLRVVRRRRLGESGPYLPYEVNIRGTNSIARVQSPVDWRFAVMTWVVMMYGGGTLLAMEFLAVSLREYGYAVPTAFAVLVMAIPAMLTVLAIYLCLNLPWWYRINRELRDLNRRYPLCGNGPGPVSQTLMVTVGWLLILPPFIAIFRACAHTRRAQHRAGCRGSAMPPWAAPFLVLCPPLLVFHLQRELNKVWTAEGVPLDPWSAGRRPGSLPWLKLARAAQPEAVAEPMRPVALAAQS